MKKFHINSNGDAGECHATVGNCPFGGDENHYVSVSDAREAFEMNMNDHVIPETLKEKKHSEELQAVLAGTLKLDDKHMNDFLEENPKLARAVELARKLDTLDNAHDDETVTDDHEDWLFDLYRDYSEDPRYTATRHDDGTATVQLKVDKDFLDKHPIENYSFSDFDAEASYSHGFVIEESNMDYETGVWTAKIPAKYIHTIEPYSYGAYRPYSAGARSFINEEGD